MAKTLEQLGWKKGGRYSGICYSKKNNEETILFTLEDNKYSVEAMWWGYIALDIDNPELLIAMANKLNELNSKLDVEKKPELKIEKTTKGYIKKNDVKKED